MVHARPGVALAPLTTLELGGRAAWYAELTHQADLPGLVAHCRSSGLIPRAIGGGSNVLVADTGFDGLVLRIATTGIKVVRIGDGRMALSVAAGHSLADLVEFSVAEGLSGLEFLTGIPGTVGATPIQNVGAYGQEVADTVVEVEVWDWLLQRRLRLTGAQCVFRHRSSLFKRSARWLILRVVFALTTAPLCSPIMYPAVADAAGVPIGGRVPLAEAAAAVYAVRAKKGMVSDPLDPDRRSVGSVFLSPRVSDSVADRLRAAGAPVNGFPDGSRRVSASWLIREAGFQLGQPLVPGVRISGKHYTLVADEGANAAAFAEASALVATGTFEATGIALTAEPDLIGRLPRYAALTYSGERRAESTIIRTS